MNCYRTQLNFVECLFYIYIVDSSSFAFCWQNPFVEFLIELLIDSVWTDNKHYHHLISKLIVLSLLSTTVGPEHEPLLWTGVVHPWQSKSGTQCGAYFRWTGPFSHQYHCKLLQTIGNQPVIQQHHQLAYVCHLLANPKSHKKMIYLLETNPLSIWHFHSNWQADIRWSMLPSQTLHTLVTVYQKRTLLRQRHGTSWWVMRWSILFPGGTTRVKQLPRVEEKEYNPSWGGLDTWMERWFQTPFMMVHRSVQRTMLTWWAHARTFFVVPVAQNFCGARGTSWS